MCQQLFKGIFLRAPLRFRPASQNWAYTPSVEKRDCRGPTCWEQLRASLRRKEGTFVSATHPYAFACARLRVG